MFYPIAIETAGTLDDRQTDSETYHSHTVLFVIGPVTEAVTGPMTNRIVFVSAHWLILAISLMLGLGNATN